jgi:NADH oxidase (H2O2-forming)
MKYDVVVIGGGTAGTYAALSARITYPEKSVTLIRREKTAIAPLGLHYLLRGLTSAGDDCALDSFLREKDIHIVIGEVTDREGPIVNLRDGRHISFGKLVLALGAVPIEPNIPGLDQPGVYLLNKSPDLLARLRKAVRTARDVLIVGGGDVGVELADELAKAGKRVTIVETKPHLLPSLLDPEFAHAIKEQLEKQGVQVVLGTGVKALVGRKSLSGADLADGRWVTAELAIVAAGFRPCIHLAQKMGLRVDAPYGIVVDEYLRTSDPDIFAAGDCTTRHGCSSSELRSEMLVSTAMVQGRLAGSNLFSINTARSFQCSVSPFSTKVGDVAVGVVGLTENQARKLGLGFVVGCSGTVDCYPHELPGATEMTVKLLFARDSHQLLGAQMLGHDLVGECVNMLSVLIQKKTTNMELDTLQIATHPLLTPSPLGHAIINATVDATKSWYPPQIQRDSRGSSPGDYLSQPAPRDRSGTI